MSRVDPSKTDEVGLAPYLGLRLHAIDAETGHALPETHYSLWGEGDWAVPFALVHGPVVPEGFVFGEPGTRCVISVSKEGYETTRVGVNLSTAPGMPRRDVRLKRLRRDHERDD